MSEFTPYSAYPWPSNSEITASALGTDAVYEPASYARQIRAAQIYHTGSAKEYLSVEEEHALAARIQDGLVAKAAQGGLEEQIIELPELPPRLEKTYLDVIAKVRDGRKAEQGLVEPNLRFSRYLARASMNILPTGDEEAMHQESVAGTRRRALLSNGLPWLPKDLTNLRSPYAVLDDRIQVANMGLLRAARSFQPEASPEDQKPFMAFAGPVIKTELTAYVRRGKAFTLKDSPDILEGPIHFPSGLGKSIAQAHQEDWQDYMTPEKREKLFEIERMQDIVPLDGLFLANMATEEVEDDIHEPPTLWAGEVVSSSEAIDPGHHILGSLLSDSIDEALKTMSEQEAGIIRLRFGLEDDKPRSLDEIGEVYGISRERVRQIEDKAMNKLRHPSRANLLRDFADFDEISEQPLRSGDIVKIERSIGRAAEQAMIVPPTIEPIPLQPRESWQAYPGERWEEPVRKTPEQIEAEQEATAEKLKDLLFDASLYNFQKSFAEQLQSPYPKILAERIEKTFGPTLEPSYIAEFWNNHLESFLGHLEERLGDDASADRATQLLARLLSEYMNDNDEILLRVPENLQGKLGYVGAWLRHGTLRVIGNAGDYAGYKMDSLARLQIDGNVGHFAGDHMKDDARLEIDGDTGDFLGNNIGGRASILVNGDVGTYCGHHMKGNATIEIMGDADEAAGFGATGGEIIVHNQSDK